MKLLTFVLVANTTRKYHDLILHGLSKKKAIVAIARKMAELMYTLLKKNSKYEPKKYVVPQARTKHLAKLAVAG